MTEQTTIGATETQAPSVDAEIIATIAHHLRTPLSSLRVAFDLMNDDESMRVLQEKPEQYRRLMVNVGRSLENIERQVADLLDIGYLQAGALTISRSPVEPAELIATAIEGTSRLARRREQMIDVSIPEETPVLRGDRKRLEQALVSLLSHSIKSSPVGATLSVAVDASDSGLAFAIADSAPAVPEGERQKMFEPFYRPADGRADNGEAGLSLAIAKSLIELHGGRVYVDSRVGGGNVFHCFIPIELSDEDSGS